MAGYGAGRTGYVPTRKTPDYAKLVEAHRFALQTAEQRREEFAEAGNEDGVLMMADGIIRLRTALARYTELAEEQGRVTA